MAQRRKPGRSECRRTGVVDLTASQEDDFVEVLKDAPRRLVMVMSV